MSDISKIIPIFVSHKGCPNDCVFCNQKKINGNSGDDVDTNYVKKTVESYIKTSVKYSDLAFFGGSFTAIDVDIQKELLEIALFYKQKGYFNNIRISTRPDAIDEEILEIQSKYGVTIIELGIQSLDEEVLLKSGRGHTVSDSIKASKLIKRHNFILGHQIMPGLPGSNPKKDIETCKKSIEMKPHIARIYPTLVIKDTELEKMYKENKYLPLTIEKAVELSAYIYSLYTVNNIDVIRIGLQSTDKVSESGDVLAGPFHPAFRQLTEEKLYQVAISNSISKYFIFKNSLQNKTEFSIVEEKCSSDEITIHADNKTMNYVVGQKKKNIEIIKNNCGINKIFLEEIRNENCIKIFARDTIIKKIDRCDIFNEFLHNNIC